MATVTIPNRPTGNQVRSIEDILADFDAITNFLNGANLDRNNLNLPNVVAGLGTVGASGIMLCAPKIYAPVGNVQLAIPTTFQAISPGNLTTNSFVVPADGQVIVELQGWYLATASNPNGFVSIGVTGHGGSTQYGYSYQVVNTASVGAVNYAGQKIMKVIATGLTPGASVQLDWAGGVEPGTTTAAIWAGNPTGISNAGGPAIMSVYSA